MGCTMSPATLLRRVSGFGFSEFFSSSLLLSSLESSDTKTMSLRYDFGFRVSDFSLWVLVSGLRRTPRFSPPESIRESTHTSVLLVLSKKAGERAREHMCTAQLCPREAGQAISLILVQKIQCKLNTSRHLNVIYDAPGFPRTELEGKKTSKQVSNEPATYCSNLHGFVLENDQLACTGE